MIRTVLVENGSSPRIGGAELLDEWSANSGDWIWVDLDDEPAQPERDLLATRFGISHLAIDDAQRKRHPPKLEIFDRYFFLLLRHFADAETARAPAFTQLAFLVGESVLRLMPACQRKSLIGRPSASCHSGALSSERRNRVSACRYSADTHTCLTIRSTWTRQTARAWPSPVPFVAGRFYTSA